LHVHTLSRRAPSTARPALRHPGGPFKASVLASRTGHNGGQDGNPSPTREATIPFRPSSCYCGPVPGPVPGTVGTSGRCGLGRGWDPGGCWPWLPFGCAGGLNGGGVSRQVPSARIRRDLLLADATRGICMDGSGVGTWRPEGAFRGGVSCAFSYSWWLPQRWLAQPARNRPASSSGSAVRNLT